MTNLPITSWPTCVVHIDADSFFVSVEQAINPKLKGLPVATGGERGIVSCASYEAKDRGVKTGMSMRDAKKLCPDLVCVESDYETYSIFSKRMFAIMRRFTPMVEEYSIDEAFADLSGLRRMHHAGFGDIALRMKQAIDRELGITVSVGVSLSKSLAKLASKCNKPSGHVVVSGKHIGELLAITPLKSVWGFGPNTVCLLEKLGVTGTLDFVSRDLSFAKKFLGKVGVDIHRELSGVMVHPVSSEAKSSYASISKVKTFTPASNDRNFLYGQALRNLEEACTKARRYQLKAQKLTVMLRSHDFKDTALEIKLPKPTASPMDLNFFMQRLFSQLCVEGIAYRSTGIVLGNLEVISETQLSFFEDPLRSLKNELVCSAIDFINDKFGRHKVHLADSLSASKRYEGLRSKLSERKKNPLAGENFRQRLGIPLLRRAS